MGEDSFGLEEAFELVDCHGTNLDHFFRLFTVQHRVGVLPCAPHLGEALEELFQLIADIFVGEHKSLEIAPEIVQNRHESALVTTFYHSNQLFLSEILEEVSDVLTHNHIQLHFLLDGQEIGKVEYLAI